MITLSPAIARPRETRHRSQLSAMLADTAVQDGLFAGLILGTRVPANVGASGAAACIGLTVLYAAMRPAQARAVFGNSWYALAFPLVALFSTFWADYPSTTLRAGLQLAVTVFAGLLVSQSRHPRAVLTGLFLVYASYGVGSLLFGHTRPIGMTHEIALLGLGGEDKNYFADAAGTALLLCLAILALCLERGFLLRGAIAMAAALACARATMLANSAGATAAAALAVGVLLALLFLRRRPPGLKLAFTVTLALVLVAGVLLFDQILAVIQQLSDKDAGLTGRGYLWYRADFIIAQHPWLGQGYFGFWTPSNPEAVGLWHYFEVRQEGTAFSFHNAYIQTLVELGRLGLLVLVATWLIGLALLLRRFVLTQSLATCFWISYLAMEFAKTPVEPVRPSTLIAPTILMFAALGFACFPVGRLQITAEPISGEEARR